MEHELEKRFPDMTINQVCDLAELGKSVLSVSESGYLVQNLLYITEEIMRSDADLACRTRYCVSELIKLSRILYEFDNIT